MTEFFIQGGKSIIKDIPFLKGRDIDKWRIGKPSNYLRHNFQCYLDPTIDTFRYSANWLSLNPKIVYRQTANTIIAAIDYGGNYLDKTMHIIVPRNRWLIQPEVFVALLNSRLFAYLYAYISQETEGRAFAQVKTTYIKKLPIPIKFESKEIAGIVKNIFPLTQSDDYLQNQAKQGKVKEYEKQIDRMVYALYNLTPDEIKIVEDAAGKGKEKI